MASVKGPNGLTLDIPDAIAKGLVDSPSGAYEYVQAEPKKPAKKSAAKPSSKR